MPAEHVYADVVIGECNRTGLVIEYRVDLVADCDHVAIQITEAGMDTAENTEEVGLHQNAGLVIVQTRGKINIHYLVVSDPILTPPPYHHDIEPRETLEVRKCDIRDADVMIAHHCNNEHAPHTRGGS
jgi:hypothetical protein